MAPHTISGVAANQKVRAIPTNDDISSKDRVHALLGAQGDENKFVVSNWYSFVNQSSKIYKIGLQIQDFQDTLSNRDKLV